MVCGQLLKLQSPLKTLLISFMLWTWKLFQHFFVLWILLVKQEGHVRGGWRLKLWRSEVKTDLRTDVSRSLLGCLEVWNQRYLLINHDRGVCVHMVDSLRSDMMSSCSGAHGCWSTAPLWPSFLSHWLFDKTSHSIELINVAGPRIFGLKHV